MTQYRSGAGCSSVPLDPLVGRDNPCEKCDAPHTNSIERVVRCGTCIVGDGKMPTKWMPLPPPAVRALINLNDETGKDLFSVECDDDVGNWLDSFETLEEAEYFINARLMLHIHATDFRDTRTTPNA